MLCAVARPLSRPALARPGLYPLLIVAFRPFWPRLATFSVRVMATVCEYLRPVTLAEAIAYLDRPGAVLVGGGTKVNPSPTAEPITVVDLQALPFDRIEGAGPRRVAIGATVTLQQLVDGAELPGSVREAARREQPSTLRSVATVGGCVAAADPSSELLATLLVHDSTVTLVSARATTKVGLDALLGSGVPAGSVITVVMLETGGVTSTARTGRTQADRPIVTAVARRAPAGEVRLALAGVADRPLLVPPVQELLAELRPPGDFRGSAEYRRALATVLGTRALEGVG